MKELLNRFFSFSLPKKYVNAIVISALVIFIILTVLVIIYPPSTLDKWFSLEVQEHFNPILDTFMYWISVMGNMPLSIILIVITACIFFLFQRKREGVFILLTMASGLITAVVKFLVNRPRPTTNVVRVIEHTTRQSFPSGHVTFYTVFFGFLMYLMWSMKDIQSSLRLMVFIICGVLVFAIGISRIYLGAHWLTDVIGGYSLGLVCLYGLVYLYKKKLDKI